MFFNLHVMQAGLHRSISSKQTNKQKNQKTKIHTHAHTHTKTKTKTNVGRQVLVQQFHTCDTKAGRSVVELQNV